MTDVWAELESLFARQIANIYPGIRVSGLNRQLQETILRRVFNVIRDIEPLLEEISTGIELYPQTVEEVIDGLLSDDVYGMVWVETEMDRLILPQLGFFLPNTSELTIHYVMGTWMPVQLIGLFELLRWIDDQDEQIDIEMEQATAPLKFCMQFSQTWKAYLNDKGRV